jgi:hypothetical protein
VVRKLSDHPVRAFLTFDGASTPPQAEGNRTSSRFHLVGNTPALPGLRYDVNDRSFAPLNTFDGATKRRTKILWIRDRTFSV